MTLTMKLRRREPVIPPHPRADEDWYRALPGERKAEFMRAHLADIQRSGELVRGQSRRMLGETMLMAALFGVGDLICPGRDLASFLGAMLLGAGLGALATRLDLDRLLTGALGLIAMIVFQWTTRGGMSPMHFLMLFPFGSMCAYLGYLREERGLD